MRENKVEEYLTLLMKSIGGMCEKHVNPGARGDPDRICVFPHDLLVFVETKWKEGEEPEDHQIRRHLKYTKRGQRVEVVRSRAEARAFMLKYRWAWSIYVPPDFVLP